MFEIPKWVAFFFWSAAMEVRGALLVTVSTNGDSLASSFLTDICLYGAFKEERLRVL